MDDEQTICALTGDPELSRVGLLGCSCDEQRAEPDHQPDRKPSYDTTHAYLSEFKTAVTVSAGEVLRKCNDRTNSVQLFDRHGQGGRARMRHAEIHAVLAAAVLIWLGHPARRCGGSYFA